MNTTLTQDQTFSSAWLYAKGYTIAQAARRIGRSTQHVHSVLNGKRESAAVMNALQALPQRPFTPRERITTR